MRHRLQLYPLATGRTFEGPCRRDLTGVVLGRSDALSRLMNPVANGVRGTAQKTR